jgi:ribosomal protein L7Ae-like RNA K-turn-binding protein
VQNKLLSNLGLAHRARKLITGTEGVRNSIKDHSALLVLVAEDASNNTKKEVSDSAHYYNAEVRIINFTMAELASALGKLHNVACVAITDIGFKTLVNNSLENQEV